MFRRFPLSVLVFALGGAAIAHASLSPLGVESVGAAVRFDSFDNYSTVTDLDDAIGVADISGSGYGFELEYNYPLLEKEKLGLDFFLRADVTEFSADGDLTLSDIEGETLESGTADFSENVVSGTFGLTVFAKLPSVKPYFGVGFGFARTKDMVKVDLDGETGRADVSSSNVAWNSVLGAEFELSERMSAKAYLAATGTSSLSNRRVSVGADLLYAFSAKVSAGAMVQYHWYNDGPDGFSFGAIGLWQF